MGTSWYDLNIWRGMRDFDTAYAHIIAAYHLRLDDGYAAVGCVRGQYKKQMPEYKDDAWCEPRADFLRFLERGAARGVLPFWWGPEHQAQVLRSSSLLGYALTSAEEPVDFLRAYGPGAATARGARAPTSRATRPPTTAGCSAATTPSSSPTATSRSGASP